MCNYLKKPLSFKKATRPRYGKSGKTTYTMKNTIAIFLILCLGGISLVQAQDAEPDETEDYVEFNDRKNVVHGVYLGLMLHGGEINGKGTAIPGIKVAYVANQQFEVGFEARFLYSDQNFQNTALADKEDLIAAYGGLHLEPILFGKSPVSLSFPILIGAGALGYVDGELEDDDFEKEIEDRFENHEVHEFFIVEPGINLLFNPSRYLQLEAGIKYRLSSKVNLTPSPLRSIDGFSAGFGVKVGIFNMGRNRYKKDLDDDE